MRLAVLGRYDRFVHRPPDRIFPAPAENLFRLGVPAGDDSFGIHLHHGVQGGLNNCTKPLLALHHYPLRLFALGNVLSRREYPVDLPGFIQQWRVMPCDRKHITATGQYIVFKVLKGSDVTVHYSGENILNFFPRWLGQIIFKPILAEDISLGKAQHFTSLPVDHLYPALRFECNQHDAGGIQIVLRPLPGFCEFLFRPLALGDVLVDTQNADDMVTFIAQRRLGGAQPDHVAVRCRRWLFVIQPGDTRFHHGLVVGAVQLGLILPYQVEVGFTGQFALAGVPGIFRKIGIATQITRIAILPEYADWRIFHDGLEQILRLAECILRPFARFKQGVESIGHSVEAVAYPAELVACAELDSLAQVALGKGVRGTDQRPDTADNGVVHGNRKIDRQQKQQQGDADSCEQRIFCPGNTRLDEGFGCRQQGYIHLRVAVVYLCGGHIQKDVRGRGKMAGEDV